MLAQTTTTHPGVKVICNENDLNIGFWDKTNFKDPYEGSHYQELVKWVKDGATDKATAQKEFDRKTDSIFLVLCVGGEVSKSFKKTGCEVKNILARLARQCVDSAYIPSEIEAVAKKDSIDKEVKLQEAKQKEFDLEVKSLQDTLHDASTADLPDGFFVSQVLELYTEAESQTAEVYRMALGIWNHREAKRLQEVAAHIILSPKKGFLQKMTMKERIAYANKKSPKNRESIVYRSSRISGKPSIFSGCYQKLLLKGILK